MTEPRFVTDLWADKPDERDLSGPIAPPGPETERYAVKALEDELYALSLAPEGQRNHALNKAAFNLGQLVNGGYLDRDNTWRSLAATARMIGLASGETNATISSAFRSATPRYITELEKVPEVTPYTPPEDAVPASLRELFPIIDWHALWADETQDEWIIEPILPARRLVALFSAPKVGKSLLLLELAVAMATGDAVLGTTLDRARIVLYVDFENDPRGDIRTRLVAMGRKPSELDNLRYLSFPRLEALDSKAGAARLLEICTEYAAEVVVIDTVSRAVQGDENENDTWLRFYRYTGLALKQAGIASIRLDHTGKDPEKGMRGGSAKYGDVDAVWQMSAVTETTFRLECKANRMPITEKVIVLRREQLPHLHHAVEGGGVLAIATARQQQLVAQLNEIYGDKTPPSLKDACKRLRERGHGARFENVRDAISVRELTFNRLPLEEEE